MKNTGKPESGGSSLSSNEQGTSEEVVEEMCLDLPANEAGSVPPVRPAEKTSYSLELFRTRRNIRWFQIPLSSLRKPKAGLFSVTFQSSLQEYQQLRKAKRLKVGRPFSILPLPKLPPLLMDSSRRASHQRRDSHRPSGAGEAKGSKRLSSHREEPQMFSRRMHTRRRKCSSSALSSRRRVSQPKTLGQPQGEEPGSSCSKKQGQVDPGRFEQDLHFDAPGPSHSSSCGSSPLSEAARGDSGYGRWVSASSPLEEEDYEFPPDWSPPRMEFLYDRGPPPLSPAPGPEPKSPSSGEMAEMVSAWAAEPPVLELTAESSSPAGGGHVHSWEGLITQPLRECESRGRASLEHPVPVFCQAVNEERERATLGNEIQMEDGKAFGVGEHPPLPSPIHARATSSPASLRSGLSMVSNEFFGDPESPAFESDEEGDQGPESPASPTPAHLLMASPRTSSRCSLSASSNELSEDPEGLTQDVAMEEGPDDSSLLPLEQFLQMSGTDLNAVEPRTGFLPSSSDGYLRSLDQLLEERRKQTWEDEQLERNLGEKLSLFSPLTSGEVPGQGEAPLPEAHRVILEQFSIPRDTIPAVHPGENIFGPPGYYPRTPVALDTSGLKPQNQLEHLFFRASSKLSKSKKSSTLGSTSVSKVHVKDPKKKKEVVKQKKAKHLSKSVQLKEPPPVRVTLPSPILEEPSRELLDPNSPSEEDGFLPQPQASMSIPTLSPTQGRSEAEIISSPALAHSSPLSIGRATAAQWSDPEKSPQRSPPRKPLTKRRHVSPDRQLPQHRDVITLPRSSRRHAMAEYEEPLHVEMERHAGRRRYRGYDIDPIYGTRDCVRPKKVRYVCAASESSLSPSPPRRRHRASLRLDPMAAKPASKHRHRDQRSSHPEKRPREPSVPLPSVSRSRVSCTRTSHQAASSRSTHPPEVEASVPVSRVATSVSRSHRHGPSPPLSFTSYSQLVMRMAKSLKLDIDQPPPPKHDLVFDDINQEKSPPPSLAFIPALLDLIKESWNQPLTSLQISRRIENRYRIHGNDTAFLSKHPAPNSIVVQLNQSRAGNHSKVTPASREGRKLDVLGRRLYSLASFIIRVSNYQAAMGAYQRHLWNKILPILQAAPEETRTTALNAHLEGMALAKWQCLASRHVAEAASKTMMLAIALRRHAWLRSAGLDDYARSQIEELPFDGAGLFNAKTDERLAKLHKMRKILRSFNVQPCKYQRQQCRSPFTSHQSYQQSYQQPYQQTYRSYKPPQERSNPPPSSATTSFRPQASCQRRQNFRHPAKKGKQYL